MILCSCSFVFGILSRRICLCLLLLCRCNSLCLEVWIFKCCGRSTAWPALRRDFISMGVNTFPLRRLSRALRLYADTLAVAGHTYTYLIESAAPHSAALRIRRQHSLSYVS